MALPVALSTALLARERSSPADLDSYKAWRASRAAKHISIALANHCKMDSYGADQLKILIRI